MRGLPSGRVGASPSLAIATAIVLRQFDAVDHLVSALVRPAGGTRKSFAADHTHLACPGPDHHDRLLGQRAGDRKRDASLPT